LTVPASVTSIYSINDGHVSFHGLTGLKTLNFYAKEVPSNNFDGLPIENLDLTGVQTISSGAFGYCTQLKTVVMSDALTGINFLAFRNCTALTDVTVAWATPLPLSGSSDIFYGVNTSAATLHVPIGTTALYKAAPIWKDFFITEISTGIQNAEIQNLKLFPNPTKDKLTITSESPINKVEIYCSNGKMLIQDNNFTGEMNVSSLAKGLYMVRVYTVQGVEIGKIIKN